MNPRWIAFQCGDTGAGGTAWPVNAGLRMRGKVSSPAGRNYKTATGDMVEGRGTFPSSMSERLGTPIAHAWRKRRQFTNRC